MEGIVVLGGGVAGLTAAYELSKKGKKAVVIEKENEAGGLARSFVYKGFVLDYGPHIFWAEHSETKKLMHEIGIKDNIYYKNLHHGVWYNNRIYDYSRFLHKLRLLPFFKRLPLFMIKIFLADKDRLKRESAAQWITKEIGNAEYKSFFEPLLFKRFGQGPETIPALDLRTIFKSMVVRGKEFYLKQGCGALAGSLAKEAARAGAKIILNASITSVKKEKNYFTIKYNNKTIKSRIAISTLPLPVLKSICGFELPKVRYSHSLCIYIGLKKQLTNLYSIVIPSKDFPFQRISNPAKAYPRKTEKGVLIVDKYFDILPRNLEKEKEKWLRCLENIFPGITKEIEWTKVVVVPFGLPLTRQYPKPAMPENFYLAGHFDSLMQFAGIEKAVISGKKAARLVLASKSNNSSN